MAKTNTIAKHDTKMKMFTYMTATMYADVDEYISRIDRNNDLGHHAETIENAIESLNVYISVLEEELKYIDDNFDRLNAIEEEDNDD